MGKKEYKAFYSGTSIAYDEHIQCFEVKKIGYTGWVEFSIGIDFNFDKGEVLFNLYQSDGRRLKIVKQKINSKTLISTIKECLGKEINNE